MKIVLLIVLFYCTEAFEKKQPLVILEKNFIDLQKKNIKELQCLHKLDEIFTSGWIENVKKIASFEDSDGNEPRLYNQPPSKNIYDTFQQEWLIEDGTTSMKIDSCFRSLVQEIVPLLSYDDVKSLNSAFARHTEKEIDQENINKKVWEEDLQEQLPFRKYVSFTELVELLFQNRNPDVLEFTERSVYENAESYLYTENDKLERNYVVQADCSWKNTRTLRELVNVDARLEEFFHQVVDTVNRRVANFVIEYWDPYKMLPNGKYERWLEAHQEMISEIKKEVAKLRGQNKNAQWLCNYAAELAYRFSEQQLRIFQNQTPSVAGTIWSESFISYHHPFSFANLKVSSLLGKIQYIEETLGALRDIRRPVVKMLLNKYKNSSTCFSAFYNMVKNNQLLDIASFFVDKRYTYPELYCRDQKISWNEITVNFCKCVGSFCVRHFLQPVSYSVTYASDNDSAIDINTLGICSVLKKEKYHLLQSPDGTYHVELVDIGMESSPTV